jgi:hypothetical protein
MDSMEWMRKEVARARERIRRWNEFDNNCDVCGENFGSHEGRAFGVVYPPPENPCDEDFLRAIST